MGTMYMHARNGKYHCIYGKVWNKKSKENKTVKVYLGIEPVRFNRGLEMKVERALGPIPEKIKLWLAKHGDYSVKDRFKKRSTIEEERIRLTQEEEKSRSDVNRILNRVTELGLALERRPISKFVHLSAVQDKTVVQEQAKWIIEKLQVYLLNESAPSIPIKVIGTVKQLS